MGEKEAAGEPTQAASSSGRAAAPAVSAPGVFFPTHERGETPAAQAHGWLVLDDEGCIRLRITKDSPAVTTLMWPPDYAASAEGGEIRILDREGRVLARVGDPVYIVGGFIGGRRALEGISGVDERTKRQLIERCPGEYFYAAPDLRIVPRSELNGKRSCQSGRRPRKTR